MRWSGKGHPERELDWPGHEERAGHLVSELQSLDRRGFVARPGHGDVRTAWVQRARQLSPEALTSLLLLLIRRAAGDGGWSYDTIWLLAELNPRKYTATDRGSRVRAAHGDRAP
jgi:hypothetical protein